MTYVALILAGGLGKRLRSVVDDRPKPMALIQGRPFLAYQLDYWIGQGVSHFILSVGYKHEMIIDYFGQEHNGATIEYVIEDKPLGTGGGLLLALQKSNINSPFLFLNGDTYFTVKLDKLISFADVNDADFTFSLFSTQDKERYMGIQLDDNCKVQSLNANINENQENFASGGVYWIRNLDVFTQFKDYLMDVRAEQIDHSTITPISFESEILPSMLAAGFDLFGFKSQEFFIDIGVPVDYLKAGLVLPMQEKDVGVMLAE